MCTGQFAEDPERSGLFVHALAAKGEVNISQYNDPKTTVLLLTDSSKEYDASIFTSIPHKHLGSLALKNLIDFSAC